MEEKDIWRAAQYIARKHGPAAPCHATERMLAMVIRHDAAGVAMWSRIMAAIRELQRLNPKSRELAN